MGPAGGGGWEDDGGTSPAYFDAFFRPHLPGYLPLPQQSLYGLPDPHGHGSFGFGIVITSVVYLNREAIASRSFPRVKAQSFPRWIGGGFGHPRQTRPE